MPETIVIVITVHSQLLVMNKVSRLKTTFFTPTEINGKLCETSDIHLNPCQLSVDYR